MSPVGVNTEIIENEKNGYLADDAETWFKYLCLLIDSFELRQKIGESARKTIEEKYSVNIWENKVLDLFNKISL
jgi:glycosyltransferase involved in cell wall biosynthesis